MVATGSGLLRPGLVGTFDIGKSYGLGDDVFPARERAPEPDIGLVGINFPLGQGILLDLTADSDEVRLWRAEAVRQVARPQMETGWSADLGITRDAFDRSLADLADGHPIDRCRLRIHALGPVYLELQFDKGVAPGYVHGLLACFEYAAYRPAVADALLEAAEKRVEAALGPELTGLVELTKRSLPEARSDAHGYAERLLINSGFTHLFACVDEGDDETLDALTSESGILAEDVIDFEYHGRLHYSWGGCVLEPNQLVGWGEPGGEGESPEEQIMRMEACIRVAHVFLATCDAFMRLFETEMHDQVGGYAARQVAGRTPEELNRLRTLALAVVNLTSFDRVSPTEEDQAYFRRFERNADITGKQRMIQHATELLYNVQVAATQEKDSRRQWILSIIVGLLTSLTLISVTADAYNFIREDESLIERQIYRVVLVGVEFLLILAILVALLFLTVRSARQRSP
jgi:hypothetical protein